ncbi:MAG: S8 family serine peptidase [Syntrophomonadaceae bacterium]|nr:S8 family serine peptidase [Syntrophomonadaceae bacterium]
MKISLKSGTSLIWRCLLGAVLLAFLGSGIFIEAALGRTFSDIEDNWAQEPISQLAGLGVVNGYQDNSFRPGDSVTRAEFACLLINALGEQREAKNLNGISSAFADMTASHWALPYVMLAREMGLLQGAGENYYPEDPVTRQEAATILGRRLQESGMAAAQTEKPGFLDIDDVNDWAIGGLDMVVEAGLMNGFPDNTFRPQDQLSRAEAVSILSRMMDAEGRLYDFHGMLRSNDGNTAIIRIDSEEYTFSFAPGAEFYLSGKRLNNISSYSNIRIAFNLDDEGHITFARLNSSPDYLDLTVSQYALRSGSEPVRAGSALEPSAVPAMEESTAQMLPMALDTGDTVAEGSNHAISTVAAQLGMSNLYQGGLSGQGVTIAVIDSGIDPVHPALQRTTQGVNKIVDWVNFSPEGMVAINNTAEAEANNSLQTVGGTVKIPDSLRSLSGVYRYGYWEEEWIAYGTAMDFTGNGLINDRIVVLLSDQSVAGVYDTVLVDTDGDGDLSEEMPLKVFRENRYNFASFPVSAALPQGFAFVLCDISDDGSKVSFGYDSAGHGTHVAGIIAASGDEITGMAPGAQLLSIKVADGTGYANLPSLLNAVEYAVKKGADIINISLGYYAASDAELESFRRRINDMASNTLICAAAGNAGPGLSSLSSPGDIYNVLSVGACRVQGETDANFTSRSGALWTTSSVGPGATGVWKPDMLAPAVAMSTLPYWTGTSNGLNEGSSMAAAFVSGTAAILIEDMYNKGRAFNSLVIRDALIGGARSQTELQQFEQGHGLLNAQGSYSYLQKQKSFLRNSDLRLYADFYGAIEGLKIVRYMPETVNLEINNPNHQELEVRWSSDQSWIKPAQADMTLPATGSRGLGLDISLPTEPGIHTALLEGVFNDISRPDFLMPVCLLIPEEWDNNGKVEKNASLSASAAQHYLLAVEEGTGDLKLTLRIEGYIGSLRGSARMFIYRPDGVLWGVTDYVGRSDSVSSGQREIEVPIASPMGGVWEIVVYSSENLADYGLARSEYGFAAEITKQPGWQRTDNDFVIGSAMAQAEGGEVKLSLCILERATMLPYSGSLLINGRQYQVEKGHAVVTATAERNAVALELRRI